MSDELGDFEGPTRLFPLPNVVLFPGMLLPLHIFEHRYREMLKDSLLDDRLITIVLLRPGYESNYEESPEIHEIGCVGRILEHEELDDGRSNLILQGLARVKIEEELLVHGHAYRTARVSVHSDSCESDQQAELVSDISAHLASFLEKLGRNIEPEKLAEFGLLSLGSITDLAASCLPCETNVKQCLLEELSVQCRGESVLAWLKKLIHERDQADNATRFNPN